MLIFVILFKFMYLPQITTLKQVYLLVQIRFMVGYATYVVFGDNNGTCKCVNMQYGRAHTDLV